jgi:uncharacterized membrane protein HdeD (DUF308 family)
MAVAGVASFVDRLAERVRGLPWGLRLGLGLVPIAVGVILLLHPFDSLTLLIAALAAGFAVDGVARAIRAGDAPRPVVAVAAGVAELVAAVVVLAVPVILSLVAVAVLLVAGLADLSAAWTGARGRRIAHAFLGAALVIFGVLAIVWPDVSLLLVAVVFALRLIAFGIAVVVRALRHRSARPPREPGRAARAVDLTARALLLALAVVAIVGSASLHRSVTQPSAFYDPPASVPGEPGRLIRSEPYSQAVPEGARGWLILYTTTDLNDEPTVGSAFVMAPEEPGDEPRDVVLWTHGTQGADRTCAPTVLPAPLPLADPIAAQQQQIAQGRVLVGPDYPGMGTAGPQGYLVGENEGRSSLDAVRAAHELTELELSWRTVVWGHSQGGQAALWTGGLAPDYAPEVELLGVSAAAPAADVKGLIASLGESWIGQLLGPYAVRSYAETYADVDAAAYIDPRMQPIYEAASRRCLPNADTTVSLLSVLTMHGTMYRVDPATGPLGDRLDENVPTLPIDVPLFIARGTADPLILPKVQEAYVAARCAAGQSMIFREYEGRDHLSVVADDSPYSADLLAWTDDRFAGRPQTEDTCR